ncbi:MAG: class I SAM-dependent methyltransferase [Clostridiales bacterium]|nr:class I SAM-dependent methyltransferase [Clostridiales bacterium]
MYNIDAVEPDYGPRKEIVQRLPEVAAHIKMYEQDSACLCALLEKQKPRKILEVGVANGGTSAVIIECMHELGSAYELHCVDILETGYAGSEHEIGFLGKEASELYGFEGRRLWKGVCLPQVIDRIGSGIDFLILDTSHVLPGETLDFLIAYPYLSEGAFVCLHDIRQNHNKPPKIDRIGTNALFNSVAADKFVNSDPTRQPDYPNFGAFRINPDTEKYITNVFGALTINWNRPLPEETLKVYTQIIQRHYPKEACWLFERAVRMNELSLSVSYNKNGKKPLLKRIAGRLARYL